MNIIVCIKQVPDTTEIKIDPVKGTLIREGVPSIMNPDDKGGLELALRLKDQFGAKVTVVSMGPPIINGISTLIITNSGSTKIKKSTVLKKV